MMMMMMTDYVNFGDFGDFECLDYVAGIGLDTRRKDKRNDIVSGIVQADLQFEEEFN